MYTVMCVDDLVSDVVVQLASHYKTVLVFNALPSALFSSLLRALRSRDVNVQTCVHRILHALLDRHNNLPQLQHIRFTASFSRA